jgi:hypothetical protein
MNKRIKSSVGDLRIDKYDEIFMILADCSDSSTMHGIDMITYECHGGDVTIGYRSPRKAEFLDVVLFKGVDTK